MLLFGRVACVAPGQSSADLDAHAGQIPIGGQVETLGLGQIPGKIRPEIRHSIRYYRITRQNPVRRAGLSGRISGIRQEKTDPAQPYSQDGFYQNIFRHFRPCKNQ